MFMQNSLFTLLKKDFRFIDGLNACINCGTCTAICPAAEFYNYDPRHIAITVQTQNDEKITELLKSETIWYCGECFSCKTRCPKNNTPGYIIQALRNLSHRLGYFTESEKGRQSLAIKRTVGEEILKTGYCVHVSSASVEMHPEQGPVWDWVRSNPEKIYGRFGARYNQEGEGVMKKISDDDLLELKKIFDLTGGTDFYNLIEEESRKKAVEMNLEFDNTNDCEYFKEVYTKNSTH
jgi:heterodisulfide reductase subunit C1